MHWEEGWEWAKQWLEPSSPWGPLDASMGMDRAHCPGWGWPWTSRVDMGQRL